MEHAPDPPWLCLRATNFSIFFVIQNLPNVLLAREANPQWWKQPSVVEANGKLLWYVYIYIYMYVCVPYVHNLEKMKKTADSKAKGMKPHAACLVNISQGKDVGVLFRLNYSIHQHTGFGCYTSS